MQESLILSEIVKNRKYAKKVLPHIKPEYFFELKNSKIFETIVKYAVKYKKIPSLTEIGNELSDSDSINESVFDECMESLNEIKTYEDENDFDWLIDKTEEFCIQRSVTNAVFKASDILDEGNPKKIQSIKSIIEDSLKVNFNREIGIEYFNEVDIDKRWELYNKKKNKFKTHIKKLNAITGGGLEEKCLHVFFGDTHVGKTMTLSALTAGFVKEGYDTLYLTLEMAKEKITSLIDSNYTDQKINELTEQGKDSFKSKIINLKNSKVGRLFVQEFPTGNASTNNFRSLLDDLKYKKNFIPKIIVVDYINLMRSDRYSDANSYVIIKAISEELRGLGVEGNYCMVSATQTNRTGAKSSDIEMTDTAESYGLPQTVDLLIGLMSNDSLKEQNLLIMKSLKNRLHGIVGSKFAVTTNFEYARLLDCENSKDIVLNNDEKTKCLLEKSSMKSKLQKLKVNKEKRKEDDFFE